jgi:hypothetical protein
MSHVMVPDIGPERHCVLNVQPQRDDRHTLPPCAVQSFAHPPQFRASVAALTSQPSLRLVLQSANPLEQETGAQAPPAHKAAVVFASEQAEQEGEAQPVAGKSLPTHARPQSFCEGLHGAAASGEAPPSTSAPPAPAFALPAIPFEPPAPEVRPATAEPPPLDVPVEPSTFPAVPPADASADLPAPPVSKTSKSCVHATTSVPASARATAWRRIRKPRPLPPHSDRRQTARFLPPPSPSMRAC